MVALVEMNEMERSDDLPTLEPGFAVGAVVLAFAMLAGTVFLVFDVPAALRDELYRPLVDGGALIRVNYSLFALPGAVVVGLISPLIIALVLLARPFRISTDRFEKAMRSLTRVFVAGGALMFAAPVLVGPVVSAYVESRDYEACGTLFEFGVARYERVFVEHPQLCVPARRLDAALRQYEQARQAQ